MLNDDTVFDAFLLASSQINHKRKALNLKQHLLTHLLLKKKDRGECKKHQVQFNSVKHMNNNLL